MDGGAKRETNPYKSTYRLPLNITAVVKCGTQFGSMRVQ